MIILYPTKDFVGITSGFKTKARPTHMGID